MFQALEHHCSKYNHIQWGVILHQNSSMKYFKLSLLLFVLENSKGQSALLDPKLFVFVLIAGRFR